jgi:hypothetical protein
MDLEQEQVDQVDPEDAYQEDPSQDNEGVSYSVNDVGRNPYSGLASQAYLNYRNQRVKDISETSKILREAQDMLLARANPERGAATTAFRIAAALGKPTRTGSFFESLSGVNEALADESERRDKYKQAYEEAKLKYKLQTVGQASDLAKEDVRYLTQMARIPQPKTPKFDVKQNAYGILQKHEEALKSGKASPYSDAQIKDARILLGLEKPPTKDKEPAFNEKKWSLDTLFDANIPNDDERKTTARSILGINKPGSIKQQAFTLIEKHRADPKSVTEDELKDARSILGLDKPAAGTAKPRQYQGLYYEAAMKLFGSANEVTDPEQTKKLNQEVDRLRQQQSQSRIDEARAKRPPPKAKAEKEPAIDLAGGQSVAQRLGVPFNDSPYRGVSDKIAGQLLISNTKTAQKTLGRYEADSSKTLKLDSDLDRFLQANQKAPTGRERSIMPSFGADYQTMEQIQASMAPENRKEGTGAVSDFDAKQLIKMSPSIANSYETNKRISLAIKAANQMARDKAKFMSDYFQANRHLDGADAAWMQYATKNPIFDRKNPDRLNQSRITYKQFFYPPEQRAAGGYMGYSDLATLRDKYAHGGVVKMQEGGDPVQSVIRLRPEARASDTGNRARAFFGQGMGMSFGDEAEALYRSMGQTNKSYDQILNEIRADYRRWAEENPGQALGFEFAGGVAPTVGSMFIPGGQAKTATDVSRAPGIIRKAIDYSTKTPTRRMVTSGAGYGAVSGFGAGEGGIGDRTLEAFESGLIGAAGGPIIGKGGELLYQGGKGIYKRLLKPGTNRIEEAALDKVLAKMAQDNITPEQAIRQVALERGYMPDPRPAGTRPKTKLRDVSPGLTDLAETVAQRPGAGRKTMIESTVKTGRDTKGRVMDITGERLGKGKTMYQTELDLTDALKDNAKTLYDDAYKFGTVTDQRILAMVDQPQFKEAYRQVMETNKIRRANAIAKGEDPSKYDMKEIYKITETQPGIYQMDLVAAPDVRTLDQMKRGLDYIIRSGRRSENAAAQDAAHALGEYKNTFLNVLDEVVPAYKVARQQYKGDLEVLDALDIGRNQYGKMSPEEATSYIGKLTPSERDAVRIGYAQQFKDKIGNAKNSINAAEEILGAENNAARLRALFDTNEEYEVFRGILKAESRNVKSAQQIGQGAATGRRRELQKEFEGDNVAAQMLDLAGGSPFNTFMRIIKKAPDLFKNEQVAASVAKILNTGRPAELNQLLRQLESRADRFALEQAKRQAIGRTGSAATGRMAGETPIGAGYVEPEVNIPSSVEGENAGVIIPGDYAPEAEEPESEETVIYEDSEPAPEPMFREEPEEEKQMKRGGKVYKGNHKALLRVKMKMKR